MQRRRLLAALAATPALAGCLETIAERVDPHVDPDADWTPTGDLADEAEALAYVTLTLSGCGGLPGIELADAADGVAAGLTTDPADPTALEDAIAGCRVVDTAHEPYADDPGAFVAETHFATAYLVAVAASDVDAIHLAAIATLPDGTTLVTADLAPGTGDRLALARVGSLGDPTGIRLRIDGTDVALDTPAP